MFDCFDSPSQKQRKWNGAERCLLQVFELHLMPSRVALYAVNHTTDERNRAR